MFETKKPGDTGASEPARDINQNDVTMVPAKKSTRFPEHVADIHAMLLHECGEDITGVRNVYSRHGNLEGLQIYLSDGDTKYVSVRSGSRPVIACRDAIDLMIGGGIMS